MDDFCTACCSAICISLTSALQALCNTKAWGTCACCACGVCGCCEKRWQDGTQTPEARKRERDDPFAGGRITEQPRRGGREGEMRVPRTDDERAKGEEEGKKDEVNGNAEAVGEAKPEGEVKHDAQSAPSAGEGPPGTK